MIDSFRLILWTGKEEWRNYEEKSNSPDYGSGHDFTGCGSSKTETANTPEAASAAQETDGAASAAAQETAGEADPYGKYEEPVTFTVAMSVDPNEVFPEGDSYTDNQYTRYIKEQLNVDVEFLLRHLLQTGTPR